MLNIPAVLSELVQQITEGRTIRHHGEISQVDKIVRKSVLI